MDALQTLTSALSAVEDRSIGRSAIPGTRRLTNLTRRYQAIHT